MTSQPLSKKEHIQWIAVVVLAVYCVGLLVYVLAVPQIKKARTLKGTPPTSYSFTSSQSASAQGRAIIVQDNCQNGCATYVFVEDPAGTLKSFGEYNSAVNRVLYALVWSKDKTVFAVRSVRGLAQPTLSEAYDFTKHAFVGQREISPLLLRRGRETASPDKAEEAKAEETLNEPQWKSLSVQQFEAMKNSASSPEKKLEKREVNAKLPRSQP